MEESKLRLIEKRKSDKKDKKRTNNDEDMNVDETNETKKPRLLHAPAVEDNTADDDDNDDIVTKF